jgi:hypothetical protein
MEFNGNRIGPCWPQSATASNFLRDVSFTGTLTVADKGLTNSVLATGLPPP